MEDESHASASEKGDEDDFRLLPVRHRDDAAVGRSASCRALIDAKLFRRWDKMKRQWNMTKRRSVTDIYLFIRIQMLN